MNSYGYGLWPLVVINSLVFIIFAASFFHPRSGRDWRALGGFSAFVVALFTEMYGYPLTIYLLTGPLGGLVPGVNLSHNSGHLWTDLIGWKGDPHMSPFHLASYVFIIGGFWLIASAWHVLSRAQREGVVAASGPYARVRHPQYLGFPILLVVYRRLAIREEKDVRAHAGDAWDGYAGRTPRFVPRIQSFSSPAPPKRPSERWGA
jgi:protein-S-isoprenylcysteine O-methyltransferase Ste14